MKGSFAPTQEHIVQWGGVLPWPYLFGRPYNASHPHNHSTGEARSARYTPLGLQTYEHVIFHGENVLTWPPCQHRNPGDFHQETRAKNQTYLFWRVVGRRVRNYSTSIKKGVPWTQEINLSPLNLTTWGIHRPTFEETRQPTWGKGVPSNKKEASSHI